MLRKIILSGFFLASSMSSHAASVTARVVADDHYKVFVGDASGSVLTEVGSSISLWPGQGAAFNFDAGVGQYIYVAAWDSPSYGPPHMWVGEFDIDGTKLYSNTVDWVGKSNGSIKNPSRTDVETLASSASPWSAVMASMPNGSYPYGSLIGGSPASFVWTDAFDGTSASENGYALFRTAEAVVTPLPGALPLMLSGMGLIALRLRRKQHHRRAGP